MRLINVDKLPFTEPQNSDYKRGWNDALWAVKEMPTITPLDAVGATKEVVELILEERRRQVEQWGEHDNNHPYEWMSILGEEFGELCRAVNETCFQNPKEPEFGGNDNIISEAVQVATVAIAIIEACLDQRKEEGDA